MIRGSFDIQIGDKKFLIEGVNQPRSPGKNMIYTNYDLRCLHHNPGFNVIISRNIIQAIYRNEIFTISDNDIILQVENVENIKIGMPVQHKYQLTTHEAIIEPDFVLGGAGILIHHGVDVSSELYDEFSKSTPLLHTNDEAAADFHSSEQQHYLIIPPHPRTALGTDEQGNLFIVVVDGRQKSSIGLTLSELAHFMKFLGCTNAINLGGGGCSTLFINGKIVNNPSQGAERPVSEALCFFSL